MNIKDNEIEQLLIKKYVEYYFNYVLEIRKYILKEDFEKANHMFVSKQKAKELIEQQIAEVDKSIQTLILINNIEKELNRQLHFDIEYK